MEGFESLVDMSLFTNDRKCILAVDDSGLVLRTIKRIIGDKYDLEFATSGEKALEMMAIKHYDLVLLDYDMPTMSGYDVFKVIKKSISMSHIPVVFLTSVSDKERILDVLTQGPAGYILKPIDHDLLHRKIRVIFYGEEYEEDEGEE